MKKGFLFISLFLLLQVVFGQSFEQTIRGIVIDAQNEKILVGATVVIVSTEPILSTTTNSNGEFVFENVPLGRQSLKISYIGYLPSDLSNILVVKGKQTVLTIKMEESSVDIAQVVVKSNKNKLSAQNEMATVSARSFTTEETERYAGSLGDPSRMAANYAGVMSVNDQRNDIIIRGNSPIGLLWRLDGIDIPNPNHFGAMGTTGGPVSMLNNNVLTNSDFFTGAFPAEYGNAMSGVFDLQMRSGNNQKFEFLGQVGFGGFEVGLEGPLLKKTGTSFLINFRYSTLEVMNELGFDVGTGAAVPRYKDLNFKINIPRGKLGSLSIFGIGGFNSIAMLDSEGDSSQYGFGGTDLWYSNQMATVGANYKLFFSNNSRLTLKLAGTYISQKTIMDSLFHNGIEDRYRFYDAKGNNMNYIIAPEFYTKINAKNNFKIGFNYKINEVSFIDSVYINELDDYIRQFDDHFYYTYGQAYAQYQYRLNNNLHFNAGVFAHYLFVNKTYNIEPRFGIKWQIAKNQAINFGAGIHSQMQIPLMYFVDSSEVKTNLDLDFNKSAQIVLGHDYFITKDFRIKTEIYYQHIYNIPITHKNEQFSILNVGDEFYLASYHNMQNKGTGKNYGVELTIEKFLSKGFYFLLTTSLFESKYTPWDGKEYNTKFNGNYVFNALGGYEIALGKYSILALDIKAMYAGGKRYIPINEELSTLERNAVYDYEDSYKLQHDPYFRINTRITFKLNDKKKNFSQEWGLDLQNITNHQNVFQQGWDVNQNEIQTYYQNGFMPMMTYRILF